MNALMAQVPTLLCALFSSAAAGVMGAAALTELRGKSRRLQMPLIVAALALAVASVVALLFKFQRIERFFNAFSHLGSAVTQALLVSLVLTILAAVLLVLLKQGRGIGKPLAAVLLAVAVGSAVVSARSVTVMGHVGAEVAVFAMYFCGLEALLGMAVFWLFGALRKDEKAAHLGTACNVGAAAVVTACYAAWLAVRANARTATLGGYVDPTRITTHAEQQTDAVGIVLGGELAPWFWGAAVVLGIVVALVLGIVSLRGERASAPSGVAMAACTLACSAVGSVAFQAVYVLSLVATKVSVFS